MTEKNLLYNESNKKIVFFDIDDTLFTPETGVPASAIEGIRKFRENGGLAFICTGRTRSMVLPDIIAVGFDGIIAGAGTYGEYDGKVLFREEMDSKEAMRIIEQLRMLGFIPVPEGHDYFYYDDKAVWPKNFKNVFGSRNSAMDKVMRPIPDSEEDICVSKVSAVFTENSKLKEAEEAFSGKYTVVNHGNRLLELIPMGKSKAVGIKKLIEVLNIPKENTYAFGDSMNDYEMLDFVEHSVAMGNAEEEIKKLARYVTDSVMEDGIYNGLKMINLI